MRKIIFLFLALILNASIANARMIFDPEPGGGGIVGNGAGSVENNFQFAYYNLEKVLETCLKVSKCGLLADQKDTVAKILQVLKINSSRNDRLIFISEKRAPDGFFTTGASEPHRIAKTFLMPNSPIYINTDMLYNPDGSPALDFQGVTRILVHELGHQTGIESHTQLDILGVRVAAYSEGETLNYRYDIEEENASITFSVINYPYPMKSTFVLFNWKGHASINLTDPIMLNTRCSTGKEAFNGIEVTNGHYDFAQDGTLLFKAWVKVYCYDMPGDKTVVYKKDLEVTLNSKYGLGDIKIEGITY